MEKKITVLKIGLYGLLAILIYIFESVFSAELKVFGAMPTLMPFLVAAVAMFEGAGPGAAFGFFAGLLCDSMSGKYGCFFTLLYMYCGIGVGKICLGYFRARFLTMALWGSLCFLITEGLRFLLFYYLFDLASSSVILTVTLPCFVYSLIVSPVAYFLVWQINRIGREPEIPISVPKKGGAKK